MPAAYPPGSFGAIRKFNFRNRLIVMPAHSAEKKSAAFSPAAAVFK